MNPNETFRLSNIRFVIKTKNIIDPLQYTSRSRKNANILPSIPPKLLSSIKSKLHRAQPPLTRHYAIIRPKLNFSSLQVQVPVILQKFEINFIIFNFFILIPNYPKTQRKSTKYFTIRPIPWEALWPTPTERLFFFLLARCARKMKSHENSYSARKIKQKNRRCFFL